MSSSPFAELGAFLTTGEAEGLATALESGQHTLTALKVVGAARRGEAKTLLAAAGVGHLAVPISVAVLRSIAGAKSTQRGLMPVWTMPGNEANVGHLTSEFHRLVKGARQSVTCATYNFMDTSKMWTTLAKASEQPSVAVTVYVDAKVGTAAEVKAQLPRATVYRSATLSGGAQVTSHAKFVVIDHEMALLTSANFSFSAEKKNVELGVLLRDAAFAQSIESMMTSKHGVLYELVAG